MSYDALVGCSACDRTVPGHRWGKIKAQDQGWFFAKDGAAFCPEHVPEWVEEWRARKAEQP